LCVVKRVENFEFRCIHASNQYITLYGLHKFDYNAEDTHSVWQSTGSTNQSCTV